MCQPGPRDKGLTNRREGAKLQQMLNYELDKTFQALADPARRAMVERLVRGPASVSELAAPLPMSLPGVLLHLKVLEQSGLVRSQKEGRVRICRIDAARLNLAEKWVAERRAMWEQNLDRLDHYLDGHAKVQPLQGPL